MWIAAFIQRGVLTTAQVGWLASGELLLCALSCIAVSVWGARFRIRSVAVLAALLMMAVNLIAAWSFRSLVAAFVIGRLASGAALGLVVSSITVTAARRANAVRTFALSLAAGMITGACFNLLAPVLMRSPAMIFVLIAAVAGVAALAMLTGLPSGRFASNPNASRTLLNLQTRSAAPLTACFAYGMVAVGSASIAPFIFVIGKGLKFDVGDMGHAIATAWILNLAGPLIAHRLGERHNVMAPLVIGAAGMAASWSGIGAFAQSGRPLHLYVNRRNSRRSLRSLRDEGDQSNRSIGSIGRFRIRIWNARRSRRANHRQCGT